MNSISMEATKEAEASKLISAITEFIPTFFSPNGVLARNEDNTKLNLNELTEQCELFFDEHANSFPNDNFRNAFVISKLYGPAKKWGLSLKADGTLNSLTYEEFKRLLLENFGDTKEQRFVLIEELLNLKQLHLGKAAFFTIEFRRLASRIGWNDDVFIDLIRRGLLEEVRLEFDKIERPKTLFEATNSIISIDKKCFINNLAKTNKSTNKSQKRKRDEHPKQEFKNNKVHKKFRKNQNKESILSANYTPNTSNSMTTTFILNNNGKKMKINVLIDSGSARSYICRDFVNANRIQLSTLSSPLNIQLPNNKSMNIRQVTKKLGLAFMDHKESYEFYVATLQLQGISAILGRDWLSIHMPYVDFKNNKIYFLENHCGNHCPSAKGNKFIFHSKDVTAAILPNNENNNVSKDKTETYSISGDELFDIDICAALVNETDKDEIINIYYQDLKIVFEKKEADKLPPHREYDISIDLVPGGQLYYGPVYSLTIVEMEALKNYLKENLDKGFIRKSKSPAGAPVLFVKKQDGSLRLCVDYRKLNSITIRNSYPIPRLVDLIESFKGAVIFTRLDLRSAYNLVRVKEGHEYLTAFRTPLGQFEYLVMPFGLRNAPSVFQRFIQDVLSDAIGIFVQVYLDDIIIYSKSLDEHIQHVRKILSLLIKNGLYVKLEKCDFHVKETIFLGFVVSVNGLSMDRNKVKAVIDWPIPKNIKELQGFLGLCNFYRKFINNFAEIIEPLRRLLKKNSSFIWDVRADNAFNKLKEAFTTEEILVYPDPEKEFFVETDASNFAVGCVLSQISNKDNKLHPVAFYSRSLSSAEINYTIYDKELLAIIVAFETWRHHLEGAKFPVQVVTDHRNLLYFKQPQKLNQRQIRWSLFLSKFTYRISFRSGIKSGKPDSLSRRPDYVNKDSTNEGYPLLDEEIFCCAPSDNLKALIEAQKSDTYCKDTLNKIKTRSNEVKSSLFTIVEGVLHFQNRIIVPSSLKAKVLKMYHDGPTNGHQGVDKTFEKLRRNYWWPNMKKDIKNYISSCDVCGRNKLRRHKPYGKIQPLPVPSRPWEIIGVDFITSLPSSQDCTCLMVVADHLTKMIHLVPCSDVPSADLTAKMLLFNVFRYHGFPKIIVSDHGSQFSSEFWTSLCSAINANPRLATAHHQQSNGQIERANSVIEQYLRCYCSTSQNEWCYYVPLCEMAYNNSLHKSIGKSPFFANYGFNPSCTIESPPVLLKDNASALTRDWSSHFEALKRHLQKAKENFKKFGDSKKATGPSFKVNDFVWLKRYYFTNEPSKKLSSQYLGPFRVLEVRERMNYRLDLPENLHLHPVFHVSQLEPYTKRNPELVDAS